MTSQHLRSLALRLLRAENCPDNTEVSVLLTGDDEIAALNRQYRDVEGPTDVLAFSQTEGGSFGPDQDTNMLGDVVISIETARRQAEEQGRSLEEEADMLLVHGILHLLGYDHAEPADEKRMFARQEELLAGKN